MLCDLESRLNCSECSECSEPLPYYGTECPVCSSFIGFPNVRKAESEEGELNSRYESATSSLEVKGATAVSQEFQDAVNSSNVVMARSLTQMIPVIANENQLVATFHGQVAANARLAEQNEFDQTREAFESKIYPYDYKDIHYAALSLNNIGISYFGNCHIKFKNDLIKRRSTVFEENVYDFLKKYQVQTTGNSKVPKGFRAAWDQRGKLAVCKLHSMLNSETSSEEFQGIVSCEDPVKGNDFIEVHIYGNIHLKSFDVITAVGQLRPPELALLDAYRPKLEDYGIKLERTVT